MTTIRRTVLQVRPSVTLIQTTALGTRPFPGLQSIPSDTLSYFPHDGPPKAQVLSLHFLQDINVNGTLILIKSTFLSITFILSRPNWQSQPHFLIIPLLKTSDSISYTITWMPSAFTTLSFYPCHCFRLQDPSFKWLLSNYSSSK